MALKVCTTFIINWDDGMAETLSVHVTKRGAKRTLIDYMVSELFRISEWDDAVTEKLTEFHDKYRCIWNNTLHQIENLKPNDTEGFYSDLQGYCQLFDQLAVFEYSEHILEG